VADDPCRLAETAVRRRLNTQHPSPARPLLPTPSSPPIVPARKEPHQVDAMKGAGPPLLVGCFPSAGSGVLMPTRRLEEAPCGRIVGRTTGSGLDLHRRRTVMVWMTPAGERLEAVRFVWDPAVLAEQIAKAGPDPEVVLEATYGWVRREGA
jgi:hypothetical protein